MAVDLTAVDDLCRLALAARRLGCRVRLEGASDDLRVALALAGVADELLAPSESLDHTGADLR